MKKILLPFLFILSPFHNAIAALPSTNVYAPTYLGGISVGVTGLYWGASASYLDYALNNNNTFENFDGKYDAGYKVNLGYVFPCTNKDISLTFTDWNHTFRETITENVLPSATSISEVSFILTEPTPVTGILGFIDVVITDPIFIAFSATLPAGYTIDSTFSDMAVSAQSNFSNHTWDLDFGQALNIGCNMHVRWLGGLRYSHLKHTLNLANEITGTSLVVGDTIGPVATETSFLRGTEVIPVFNITALIHEQARFKQNFDGIGPRFGLDMDYHLFQNLNVTGSLSTALLFGEASSNFSKRLEASGVVTLNAATTFPGVVEFYEEGGLPIVGVPIAIAPLGPLPFEALTNEMDFKHPSETRIVPSLDAKLGLNLTFIANNCSHTKMVFEAGYMVSHYYHALTQLSHAGATMPEANPYNIQNINFDGPYLGAQVIF